MAVKVVATPCLQWSQPSVSHSSSSSTSSKTLASAMNSLSSKRASYDGVFTSRSAWLGTMSSKIHRTRSLEFNPKTTTTHSHSIRRACSASFDNFSDEEFSKKMEELASKFRFQTIDDDENLNESRIESVSDSDSNLNSNFRGEDSSMELQWPEIHKEPPDWAAAASIEMKANSVDLPLSLRIIKRKKKQWQEAKETAYCSVKKAFSSMVFIIRELHSYTLQMRELLFYEDLQGILVRVQKEMNSSFVWLFQQVFSHTPTLMVYVMILLANFTVHSMSNSAAIAALPPPSISATVEEREFESTSKFDSLKSFSLTSSSGGSKMTSVGGSNGGGNKGKPVASGMDGGDAWVKQSSGNLHRPIVPDGVSVSTSAEEEEEEEVWTAMVEEASRMQGEVRDESLDHDTCQRFVSPVTAKVADVAGEDYYEEYFRTELQYQTGLAQEPNNVMLLANYAQFLYLVAHDYDRAEEYFKRAIGVEPKDAEAHSKYANFLWQVKKDLWAAEETFLEAISADPTNSYYAANYAHFLWSTGGEDTCFPLDDDHNNTLDA